MKGSSDEKIELNYDGFQKASLSKEKIIKKLDYARDNRIFTGVKVVDDVFGGILPNDLVLLGAKTGVGKTALASQIALYNAGINKKVYMYALEAEEDEIQMRIIYELVVAKAMAHNPRSKYNFKHWRLGKYKELECYYEECLKSVNNFENFHVYYRKKEFGLADFIKITMSIKNEADLIIVDHIHYFDTDGGKNENKELGDIIKKIRDIALLTGVPVVLLAHLRKSTGVNYKLVPDIDDFMGTSDLSKICTKGVILAPGPIEGDIVPTLFYFPKFRGFSAPSRYLFKCGYNIYKNKYLTTYETYNFKYNNLQFKFSENLIDEESISWLG